MAQDEAIKKVIDNNKLHLGWFISKKKDYGELNLRMENEQGDHLLLAFEQPETIAFLEISNESKLCRSNEKSCPLVREILMTIWEIKRKQANGVLGKDTSYKDGNSIQEKDRYYD